MNRRRAVTLLGVPAALALDRTFPARAQTPSSLRVGASLDDGIWPLLYGLQAGLFAKNGLDVQPMRLANGAALAAAIIGGAVDIGKSSLMALITAHARGISFKLVAGAAYHDPSDRSDQLSVLKESPLTSLGQAGGKTIALESLQSLDEFGTAGLIEKDGGDPSTVRWIEMPYSAMLAALEQGRADIASIGNPNLTVALESGKIRNLGIPYDGIASHLLIAGWFSSEQYAAENRPVVERFAAVMRRATIYTNAHHAEMIPIVAAYAHLDPAMLQKENFIRNTTRLDPSDIQPVIDAAVKFKLIDRGFPAADLIASYELG